MKFLLIAALFVSAAAFANDGGSVSNGGDICENRFKIVRDDLQSWMLAGGSAGLVLPSGVSHAQYNQVMLQQIQNAKISCTDDKIFVGVAEKTCKNFIAFDGSVLINCNAHRFMDTLESDQYVLVHHEYAGLAGLEVNSDESSEYKISNQITGFLENQTVKKLVVKPIVSPFNDPFNPQSCTGNPMTFEKSLSYFKPGTSTHLFDGTSFGFWARERTCVSLTGCTEWTAVDPAKAEVGYEGSYRSAATLKEVDLWLELDAVNKQSHFRFNICSLMGESSCDRLNFNFVNSDITNPVKQVSSVDMQEAKNHFIAEPVSFSPSSNHASGFPMQPTGIITDRCWRFSQLNRREGLNGYSFETEYVLMGTYR